MKSSVNANNTVDHNNLFLQHLAHSVANSAGTKGFIPFGKLNEKNSQNEFLFQESLNTSDIQFRSASQKPLTAEQHSNKKKIGMFTRGDSFKDSRA